MGRCRGASGILLGLWLCIAAHAVTLSSEQKSGALEVHRLEPAAEQRETLPPAVLTQKKGEQAPAQEEPPRLETKNTTILDVLDTRELDEMVMAGGQRAKKQHMHLKNMTENLKGNASISELSKNAVQNQQQRLQEQEKGAAKQQGLEAASDRLAQAALAGNTSEMLNILKEAVTNETKLRNETIRERNQASKLTPK